LSVARWRIVSYSQKYVFFYHLHSSIYCPRFKSPCVAVYRKRRRRAHRPRHFDSTVTPGYHDRGRARRGASGALDPQTAIAGSKSLPRGSSPGLVWRSGVEGWVLRGEGLRTPSGPEGSSGKQIPSGDAGRPGLSRLAGPSRAGNHNGGCTTVTSQGVGLGPPLFCPGESPSICDVVTTHISTIDVEAMRGPASCLRTAPSVGVVHPAQGLSPWADVWRQDAGDRHTLPLGSEAALSILNPGTG